MPRLTQAKDGALFALYMSASKKGPVVGISDEGTKAGKTENATLAFKAAADDSQLTYYMHSLVRAPALKSSY